MKGGILKKLLWVDLSKGVTEIMEPGLDLYRQFLGGYGLGARLIYERQKPRLAPLDPANILGFAAGPLTGTPAISSSRYTVIGKSPLTGTWGDANSGGFLGPALKKAGYDGVFFEGERRIVVKAPAELPSLIMGYRAPSLVTTDAPWKAYALEVLAERARWR